MINAEQLTTQLFGPDTMFAWPGGARVAVCFTIDIDAESVWLGADDDDDYSTNLTRLSDANYGIRVGLTRLLQIFDRYGVPLTCYVPGRTAELHPRTISSLRDAGHEIGLHGYLHRRPDRLTDDEQVEEIEGGLDALQSVVGVKPAGYRAPYWELPVATFCRVVDRGLLYDSSLMGADDPYVAHYNGRKCVELPVSWLLDDGPYFRWAAGPPSQPTPPSEFATTWLSEYRAAELRGGLITFTLEPSITGRPSRAEALEAVVRGIVESQHSVWFARHSEAARCVEPLATTYDEGRIECQTSATTGSR